MHELNGEKIKNKTHKIVFTSRIYKKIKWVTYRDWLEYEKNHWPKWF